MEPRLRRPLRARDPHELHRVSTPLELLFDLCFVVAVAADASHLHHALAQGHAIRGILGYAMVFFGIWWAWMNFTWFASAYDNDDAPYRVTVLVQMLGVLVIAASVHAAFAGDFKIMTIGYVVMRVGLVIQWLRAARSDPPRRKTALRYAVGVSLCQLGWIGLLFLPTNLRTIGWAVMVVSELAVPVWAERAEPTTWHPHHIAERYSLLTLIVLGECILSTTVAIQAALEGSDSPSPHLIALVAGSPVIVFSMWWLYFSGPRSHHRASTSATFIWGYGHLVVFCSAAAVGAGLAVAVDQLAGQAAQGHHVLSDVQAHLALAIPLMLYLGSVWIMHIGPARGGRVRRFAYPLVIVLVFAACFSDWAVPVMAGALALLVLVSSLDPALNPH